MPRIKGKGRQKIEMKKIEDNDALQVTFTKRREGLFKNAMELNAICDAETALVFFSPTGKPYSFGHPSVKEVYDWLSGENPDPDNAALESYRNKELSEAYNQYHKICSQLEAEKRKVEKLKVDGQNASQAEDQALWEQPIENLDVKQLEELQETFQKLHYNVGHQLVRNQVSNNNSAASPSNYPSSYGGANHV